MIERAMQRTLFLVLCLFIDLGYVRVVHGQQVASQVTEPSSTITSDVVNQDVLDYYLTPQDGSGLTLPSVEDSTSSPMSFWDALVSHMASIGSTDEDLALTSPLANPTLSTESMVPELVWTSASTSTTTEVPEIMSQIAYDEHEKNGSICDITNFNYVSYSHSINTSWEGCGDSYTVKLTKAVYDRKEIPHIRWLNESSMYKFERLEECTAYNISIESDDGDVYSTTIRTLPGPVEGLQSVVRNHTISLTWNPPTNENCDTFQVRFNDKIQSQSKRNAFSASYDQTRCTEINVASVDANNKTGNMVTRAVPGVVNDLNVTFYANHIEVTWNAPDDSSCVVGYYVRVNEEQSDLITGTDYNSTNLEACSEYTVGVAAVSDSEVGQFEEKSETTKVPVNIAAVQNLKAEFSEDTLATTWSPPPLQGMCITRYRIVTWDQEGVTIETYVTVTNHSFTPVKWCMEYNVMVVPQVGVRDGVSNTVKFTIPAKETNAPTLISVQADKFSSTINLRLESRTTNMCAINSIIVNCTAIEDNPPFWVITEKSVEQVHTDSAGRQATVKLEDISPFTNYRCYAYAQNSEGISDASEEFEFRTLEELPSEPVNLKYQEDEDGVLVTWERPIMVPGNEGPYGVSLQPERSLHYISEECDIPMEMIVNQTSNLQYRFEEVLPSFAYVLKVAASTGEGFGPAASLQVATRSKKSGPPRNVTTVINNVPADVYDATFLATWQLPCDINGELKYFAWVLDGHSIEDDTSDRRSDTIDPNPESDTYSLMIPDLKPGFTYTVAIAAHSGDDEMEGEKYTENFVSPDGYPSAPENLVVNVLSGTSANITWSEPSNKNGVIRSYRLSIYTKGPRHYIPPNDCPVESDPEYIYTLEPETLFFAFNEGLPNFGYNLSVSAGTSVGYGAERYTEITTFSQEPEPPRNMAADIQNILGETYQAFTSITWKLPCNTNGNLAYFSWELIEVPFEGTPQEPLLGKIEPNEPISNETYEIWFDNLRARSECSFILTPFVDDRQPISGEPSFVNFTMPDGYSSSPTDIRIENLTSNSGMLMWGEPLNKNGIIRSYRIGGINHGPLHTIPESCEIDYGASFNNTVNAETFSEPLDIRPNFKYTAFVVAGTDAGYGNEDEIEFTAPPSESEAPRNITADIKNILGETYNAFASITWMLPCNTNGNFAYFSWELIEVPLEGTPQEPLSGKIEPNEPISNETYEIWFDNLRARSEYSFILTPFVDDKQPIGGEQSFVNFTMPDGYSSSPTDIRIENLTSNSGILTWGEPLNKNGIIRSYRIGGINHGPLHTIPENCEIDYGASFNNTVNAETFSEPLDIRPNFKYTAFVVAGTDAGYGNEDDIEFIAPPSESEPPREVQLSSYNDLNETYNVTCELQWLTPCNSNGILDHFLLVVTRTSVEDPANTSSQRVTFEFAPDEPFYYAILREFLPLYKYEFSLTPIAKVNNETEIVGQSYTTEFESPDGWPSAPVNLRVENIQPEFGDILWEEPANKNGNITEYKLIVTTTGPHYTLPAGCSIAYENVLYNVTVDPSVHAYAIRTMSNFLYEVELTASTRVTYGTKSSVPFQTIAAPPATLANIKSAITHEKTENYTSYINISFDRPCELNDNFGSYAVNIVGKRQGFQDDKHAFTIVDYQSNYFSLDLQPEFSYSGDIRVLTNSAQSITSIDNFAAAAGVPSRSTRTLETPTLTPTTASISFDNQLFDRSHGDIIYYAIIINVGSEASDEFGELYDFWDTWPNIGYWSNSMSNEEYQTTPEFWNPFDENTRAVDYTYVIGDGNCTINSTTYCNGPLKPEMGYTVKIRGFTATAYRDTASIFFVTPSEWSYLPLLLGLILGLLAAFVLLVFIFILWRRRRKKDVDNTEKIVVVGETKPPLIPKNNFVEHCLMFEENRSQLKAEYSLLDRLSAADKPSSNIAMADNNKKKNRYINIMAYDDTRVKLGADSNDNYEDYINASYIKGYSGRAEYIATQGPMESTLEDFWRMIMQEDVGIIVMVAQCVEQSKQKCYKYFPDKEEIMTVGKDINVKCASEANLNDYIIRTLIVERDGDQKVIKHLQYMLWPDFGCPTNTISMLEFREMVRKNVENTKNKAVVHCSAGVGRTGTLIAVDILLQKIYNSNEDIDVFGTVLDLRRQRTHMVQTEKQYEYIHKCIRDYLQRPKPTSEENDFEPIYENVNIINGYADIKGATIGQSSTENLIRLKEMA